MPMRVVALVVPCLAVMVFLAGCALVPDQDPDLTPTALPGGGAAVAADGFGPLDPLPGSRSVRAPSFALHAPAEFQQTQRDGPDGVPMLVLSKPSRQDGGIVEVVAFAHESTTGAEEEMSILEVRLRAERGAQDVTRDSVAWPDAEDAVLVRWVRPIGAVPFAERVAQLTVEPRPGRLVTVIAVAPDAEFESSGVTDVLRTLELTAG